jgi:hypothetical protein
MSTPYAGEAGILLHMFGKFMILKQFLVTSISSKACKR